MNRLGRSNPFSVGDIFGGYCGGAFGRDSYGTKVVVAVGRDWIVVREGDDLHLFQETLGRMSLQDLFERIEEEERRRDADED